MRSFRRGRNTALKGRYVMMSPRKPLRTRRGGGRLVLCVAPAGTEGPHVTRTRVTQASQSPSYAARLLPKAPRDQGQQRASFHTYPAVHRQVRAGGETAVIAGKERDSSGNVFRLSDAAKRRHGGDTLSLLGRNT